MGKIIAVANQKGGVGKTTTTINLAASLSIKKNKKVLIIDIDPQGNASSGLGVVKNQIKHSTYDILVNDLAIEDCIIHTTFKNLSICPSNIQLAGAEIELVSLVSRESRLKKQIHKIASQYDFIIIDCPPSLGLLTINALTASDSLLMPIQSEYYALEGLSQLLNTFELVRMHLNPKLEIEGVLITMYDNRTNLSGQVTEEVTKYFKDKVFKSFIPRNVKLSEAPSHGMPILDYAPKSKGCECYLNLAKEVIKNNQQ